MYRIIVVLSIVTFMVFNANDVLAQQPKLSPFQEVAQIIIDKQISKNVTAAISLQSTSNQHILIPSDLINKIDETDRVLAVILTNEEQCVLGVREETCVMINISREGIEGGIIAIQDTAREVGDSLITEINDVFDIETKFHSAFLHHQDETNVLLETSGIISGRGIVSAVYTMPREDTESMYQKLSAMLLSKEIRDSGGFYDVARKLSSDENARMTISVIPQAGKSLLQIKVSVDYPNTALSVDEVRPLEFLKVNELKRSNYFSPDFYPLNSLLKVVLLSSEPVKVNEVSTNIVPTVCRDGERLPDFTNDGWFFDKDSGNKIEATYLFGKKFSVKENELIFTVIPFDNTEPVKDGIVCPTESEFDSSTIVILVGVITAGVGASIYYLKGFRKKS